MTALADRIRSQHRGSSIAAPASASRLAALEHYGLRYEMLDDLAVLVEQQYRFNIAGSSWVHVSERDCHGYLVASMFADFKKRNSEKLAPGRDSGAAFLKPPTDPVVALAESGASPQSSLTLPGVNPWP